MLGWINAHKAATVAVIIAVALVAGGLMARTSSGASDDDGSSEQTAPVSSLPTTTTEAPDEAVPSTSTSPPAATSDTGTDGAGDGEVVDEDELDLPIDPSASRRVRSEAGARQSAIDYASTVRQRILYLKPEPARDVLDDWRAQGVSSQEITSTIGELEELRDVLTAGGGEVWWLVSPLAVNVEAYGADRARVSVWTVTVMASGGTRDGGEVVVPTAIYSRETVELMWHDDQGWSVWDVTSEPGPVPMLQADSEISAPEEFIRWLDGFELIRSHR